MFHSLRSRMLVTAAVVLIVFLGLVGLVLDEAFQSSAAQSQQEKMQIQVYNLLAVSEFFDGSLRLPEELSEPSFNNLGTGLFGLVFAMNGEELWRSTSALGFALDATDRNVLTAELDVGESDFGVLPSGQFYHRYSVLWQVEANLSETFTYVVLEDQSAFTNAVREFRNSLWLGLLVAVGVLVFLQALIMSWGLNPLGQLAADLMAIEDGERDRLSGNYPAELTKLTSNLNLLIASEREQRERYRTTLADLAHSLKTPLAILRSALEDVKQDEKISDELIDTVSTQITRMNDTISYQLERAVIRGTTLTQTTIVVPPVLSQLTSALGRIYPDMEIDCELGACEFKGDERDLMELVGNVLDNACKYGRSIVELKSYSNEDGTMVLTIEDDGPGISEELRTSVLNRGTRLDSQAPGQGIGLAIVNELVQRYGGIMEIEDSPLGGVRIRLVI